MLDKQQLIDFERQVAYLWEAGEIKAPVHLSGGNEEQLIDIFKEIKRHDIVFSGHRNHYHALLHGIQPATLLDEILGKTPQALCKGHARSMGFIDAAHGFYSSAIVGGMCAPAVGAAWAIKDAWESDPLSIDELASMRHVWCFVGDGALDGGHFWEALQYARAWALPITFVVEDNNRATCTAIDSRFRLGHMDPMTIYVRYYSYTPTWPHVGTGTYVQF